MNKKFVKFISLFIALVITFSFGGVIANAAANYGTEQDGISGSAIDLPATNYFLNGEFNEGLKYFGDIRKRKASDVAKIEKSGSNRYMVLERNTPENAAHGVNSNVFKIKNLKAGDVIAFMFDYKVDKVLDNNVAQSFLYGNLIAYGSSKTTYKSGKNDLNITENTQLLENDYIKTPSGFKTAAQMAIVADSGDAQFYVNIYMQYKASARVYIDNIRVLVRHNSGDNKTKSGYYENTDGTLVKDNIFTGCTVNTGSKNIKEIEAGVNDYNPEGLVYSWIGTEKDGIYSNLRDLGSAWPTRTSFMNGDFSKGLQYWFESRSTGYTSKNVKLKTESNGNKYVTIAENNELTQINQTHFRLPVTEGTNIYLMCNFRGLGMLNMEAYLRNVAEGIKAKRISCLAEVLVEPQTEEEWGVAVSSNCITVLGPDAIAPDKENGPTAFGKEFAYYMQLNADEKIDLDNIRFVTMDSNGNYFELDGTAIEINPNVLQLETDTNLAFDWSKAEHTVAGNGEKSPLSNANDNENENTSTSNAIIYVIIAVAILVSGGILTFVILKRKTK